MNSRRFLSAILSLLFLTAAGGPQLAGSEINGTIQLPEIITTDVGTPFVLISRRGEVVQRTNCSADGRFTIDTPDDEQPFDMVALADGCVPICIAGLKDVNTEIVLQLGSPSFFGESGPLTADQIAEEVRTVFRRIEEADTMLPDTPEFDQILKSATDSLVSLQPMTVLIPAYFYPNGATLQEWTRLQALCNSLRGNAVVIMNINSGQPTSQIDANYLKMARTLQRGRVRWIGYLAMGYGQKDPQQLLTNVNQWLQYPGCEGFFFDEAPSRDADKFEPLLQAIRQAMRLKRIRNPLLIANPGSQTDDSYGNPGLFTDVCVLENSFGAVEYRRPDWQTDNKDITAGAILHDVGTATKVRSAFQEIAAQRGSFVYFTDQIDGRETLWTRMPSQEVTNTMADVVRQWNNSVQTTNSNVKKLMKK